MSEARSPRLLAPVLAVLALLLILSYAMARPPGALPEDAPAAEFAGARAMAVIRRVFPDARPHPIGSAANAEVRERILAEFGAIGIDAETHEGIGCTYRGGRCGYVKNIVARIDGSERGLGVMLTAHHDSVGAGPGIGDDGSGVGIVLEVARALGKGPKPRRDVILFIGDGEESGLLGAASFVAEDPWASDVGVVVNVEARGSSGLSRMFETKGPNGWLLDAYLRDTVRPSASALSAAVYREMPNDTDLTVFGAHGYPGLNLAFADGWTHYHTPRDDLEHLDPASVQHQGGAALSAIRGLMDADLENPPSDERVYSDVLGLFVVQWPVGWSVGLAALSALLVALGGWLAIRSGRSSVRALLWALPALPIAVLGSVLVVTGLGVALASMSGLPDAWIAAPRPMRACVWFTTLSCCTATVYLLAPRTDAGSFTVAAWGWWSLFALVTSILFPAASILATVPALAAGGTLVIALVTKRGRGPAVPVGLVWAGALWFPLALALEVGFGWYLPGLIALVLGMVGGVAMPAMSRPIDRVSLRRSSTVFAGLGVLAFVTANLVDTETHDRPRALSFTHLELRHEAEARWIAGGFGNPLPAPVRAVMRWSDEPVEALPWSSRRGFVAPSSPSPEAGPSLQLLDTSKSADGAGRRLHLRFQSRRGASRAAILLPSEVFSGFTLEGRSVASFEREVGGEPHRGLQLRGLPAPGAALVVELAAGAPATTTFTILDEAPLDDGREDVVDLRAARPPAFVPRHDGDLDIIVDRVEL